MKISKDKSNFNVYKAELSYGELLMWRDALAKSPGMGPEADEILRGLDFYLNRVPEPGEEPESKDGTSDNPNQAKSAADDALAAMTLPEAPGEDSAKPEGDQQPAKKEGDDDETLGDHLNANKKEPKEEEELPEPPTRK
jgi:hypothetical protein